MPIYEYECPTCGHRFEQMVKMSAPVPPCPECAGIEVRKLVSASGFILTGGGWYKDHYGLKGGGGDKPAAKADGAKTEGAKTDGAAPKKESSSTPSAAQSAAAAPASAPAKTGT